MNVPLPVLVAIGALVVLLAWLALVRRGRSRDLIAPPPALDARPAAVPARPAAPRAAPGAIELPPEVEAEVRALLGARRKIEAIKLARANCRSSLKDAKEFVERM
jgi:hypothetical protein